MRAMLFAIGLCLWATLAFAQDKLIFAIDIMRHGARTPTMAIPNDPYPWPQGLGELTPEGMQQAYQLGVKKRLDYVKRYKLLPPHYAAPTLRIRSTDYNRTLMSAASFLLGLYPMGTGPLYQHAFALPHGYQPIPIHTTSGTHDDVLAPLDAKAEAFATLVKEVMKQPNWRQKEAQFDTQFKRWSTLSGIPIHHLGDITDLGDNLQVRMRLAVPLPKGFTEKDALAMIELSDWAYLNLFADPTIATFVAKPLLKEMDHALKQAAHQPSRMKYHLYVAHDYNLLGILNAFKLPVNTIPPYTANFTILLFETAQKTHYVTLTYNQAPLTLPTCETACPLEKFHAIVEKIYS